MKNFTTEVSEILESELNTTSSDDDITSILAEGITNMTLIL